MANVPYEGATSGRKARDEVTKMLRKYGAQSVGYMDEFETKTVMLQFSYMGRNIQMRANAQGWANYYVKQKPHTYRMTRTLHQYEQDALDQGMIAVDSIIRDWVKGQMTAIETGVLTFEGVFMPYMLTNDGRTLAERSVELLPPPRENHDVGSN